MSQQHNEIREGDEIYCTKCHKRWGVDEEAPPCVEKEKVSNQPSYDLTWGEFKQLVDSIDDVTDSTLIDSMRLKASSNLVFVALNEDGEIQVCD